MSAVDVSARLRWFAGTRRICTVAANLMDALHSGFWIGVLRDETFQSFDIHPHQLRSPNNDVMLAPSGLESWEQDCLATHFRISKSMLLVAGDGGREFVSFLKRGMDVDAVDFSSDMVDSANRLLADSGLSERVVLAPRHALPEPAKNYDSMWIGRQLLSTIRGRRRRVAFLKQLRDHATDHATLLLSFYIRGNNGLEWRLNQWLGNGRILTCNPGDRIELGDHLDTEVPLYHHHYLEAELREELRQSGWQLSQYGTDWIGYAIAGPSDVKPCDAASQTKLQQV